MTSKIREALEEAVRLYSDMGLLANDKAAGAWINSAREALALFQKGDRVRKIKGASWQGKVVGFYSTELTPIGYAVESEREPGSVQIYPEAALEKVKT